MISKKGVKHGPPLRPLLSHAPLRFFLASVHALGFCFPSLVFFTLICLYFELCPVNTPPLGARVGILLLFAFGYNGQRGASRPEKERKKKKTSRSVLLLLFSKQPPVPVVFVCAARKRKDRQIDRQREREREREREQF